MQAVYLEKVRSRGCPFKDLQSSMVLANFDYLAPCKMETQLSSSVSYIVKRIKHFRSFVSLFNQKLQHCYSLNKLLKISGFGWCPDILNTIFFIRIMYHLLWDFVKILPVELRRSAAAVQAVMEHREGGEFFLPMGELGDALSQQKTANGSEGNKSITTVCFSLWGQSGENIHIRRN